MADSSSPAPPQSDRRKASQFAVESDSSSRRESRLVNFIPTAGVTSSNAGRSQNGTVDPSQSRSTNPNAPAPDDIRQAPASLPGPLRAVLQFVIFDTLLEDDDFLTVIRKVLLTVAALFGVFMPGYGAVFLALHGTTAANITFALAAAVFFEFVPLFAYVRVTRRVPERAMLATMAAALVALALGAASAPHVPFGTFIGLWAMTMAIIDAPLIAAWYAAAAPALGLAAYNEALQVRHEGAAGYDGTPALIGGFDLPTVAERMALHFGAAVIVVCMALVVKAVNGESQFQIAKAKKSAVLARLVSGQLARYQTERASYLLALARGDEDGAHRLAESGWQVPVDELGGGTASETLVGADPALCTVLSDIAVNLEQFRPHLPNWVVEAAMADRGEGDEEGDDEDLPEIVEHDEDDDPDAKSLSRGSFEESPRHTPRSSAAGSDGNQTPSRTGSHRSDGMTSDQQSKTSGQRSGSAHSPKPQTGFPLVHQLAMGPRGQRVARARVWFCVCAPGSSAAQVDATHRVVNATYGAAAATNAAVHSCVGDIIEVTWNAATKTAQAASKAGAFLNKLRTFRDTVNADGASLSALGSTSLKVPGSPAGGGGGGKQLLWMAGAAAVGDSHVQMAGTGISQALAVSTPTWRALFDGLTAFARTHQAFVADEHVATQGVTLITQAVTVLSVLAAGPAAQQSSHHTRREQRRSSSKRLSRKGTSMDLASVPSSTQSSMVVRSPKGSPKGGKPPHGSSSSFTIATPSQAVLLPGTVEPRSPKTVDVAKPAVGTTSTATDESTGGTTTANTTTSGQAASMTRTTSRKNSRVPRSPTGSVRGAARSRSPVGSGRSSPVPTSAVASGNFTQQRSGSAISFDKYPAAGRGGGPSAFVPALPELPSTVAKTWVFEVVGERTGAADDEWMYVLAKGNDTGASSVTAAFDLCRQGLFREAEVALESIVANGASSLVMWMLERVRLLAASGCSDPDDFVIAFNDAVGA